MDVAKEEIVKTEELETRYERYKGILKDRSEEHTSELQSRRSN